MRAPYGTWKSPLTSEAVTAKSTSVDDVIVDRVKGTVYHLERRPKEGGRSVLVDTRTNKDLVPAGFNVRTRVQEYGGGAALALDGVVYVSKFDDGRVYRIRDGGAPEPVTPESKVWRYADFDPHPHHPHILVAVLEDHTHPEPADVQTSLCILDTHAQTVTPLLSGADFYNAPRFSADGQALAFSSWQHPDMPWEGGQIHVAPVEVESSGEHVKLQLGEATHVAGTPGAIAATYPLWADAGHDALYFLSDEGGPRFANPWTWARGRDAQPALPHPVAEEYGSPPWKIGEAYEAVLDGGLRVTVAIKGGRSVLYALDGAGGAKEVPSPFVAVHSLRRAGPRKVVFVGATTDAAPAVVLASFGDSLAPTFEVLTKPAESALTGDILAKPEALTLTGAGGAPLHVIFYPPTNPAYEGSSVPGERPPCVFSAHGGPTGFADSSLHSTVQFYTSRGFAWCDVNYGGSSGYGREYTQRLAGNWGVVDVQDMIAAADALSSGEHARVDGSRLCIVGGSAGGYTVLATLVDAQRPEVFAAGTSMYGISELVALTEDTHKFESKYMERLLGGTPAEIPDVYRERSPVHHADRIRTPLLIMQGSEDRVVPPAQSELIVDAIKKRGGDVKYVLFEGEGHGFRRAENLRRALDEELAFYERVLKLHA